MADTTIFQRLALDVRLPLDAETLVYELLNRAYPNDVWPDVHVFSEIDLDLNAMAETGRVILYSVESPKQRDRGLWEFTVTFTVLGADVNNPYGLSRDLYKRVMGWPFEDATMSGKISRIVSMDAPERRSDAKENQGKNIKEYGFDALMDARDIQ
ncbi:hypothetical protein [Bifidobacterium sp. SO1]|uniref:hypothetical protein n=1 Tax=Bifidobacterium sp. SO1 TaxID=2809029 RepID=UPI001BDC1AA7|nr:hypothetical protein [Bifidobacterium sp. SO1]MBT1161209.1 hypothetical protein [Bifidobacterium sp. SO1]